VTFVGSIEEELKEMQGIDSYAMQGQGRGGRRIEEFGTLGGVRDLIVEMLFNEHTVERCWVEYSRCATGCKGRRVKAD